MKTIKLGKINRCIVGSVRLPQKVFDKVVKIADTHGVSRAEVVRSIIEEYIDEVNFK